MLFPMNAGGGGDLVETVLWTNPSPTSSFSPQIITLNDNWDNYDYIEVDFKAFNTYDNSCIAPIIIDMSHYAEGAYGSAKAHTGQTSYNYGIATSNYVWWASGGDYQRGFRLYDDNSVNNQVRFFSCNKVDSTEDNNAVCIPLFIYGLKKQSGGGTSTQTAKGYYGTVADNSTVELNFNPNHVVIYYKGTDNYSYVLEYDNGSYYRTYSGSSSFRQNMGEALYNYFRISENTVLLNVYSATSIYMVATE